MTYLHLQVPRQSCSKGTQTDVVPPTDSRKRRCLQAPQSSSSDSVKSPSKSDINVSVDESPHQEHSADSTTQDQASSSKQEPKQEKVEIDEAVEVGRENSLHDTLAKPMSHNELAQVCEG